MYYRMDATPICRRRGSSFLILYQNFGKLARQTNGSKKIGK